MAASSRTFAAPCRACTVAPVRRFPPPALRLGLAVALACAALPAQASATKLRGAALVSIDAAGEASGNGASATAAVTPSGRYVVFVSMATDLVPGIADTNSAPDVFWRDQQTGQ